MKNEKILLENLENMPDFLYICSPKVNNKDIE